MNDFNLVFVLGSQMYQAALAYMQQVFALYICMYVYHIFGLNILDILTQYHRPKSMLLD